MGSYDRGRAPVGLLAEMPVEYVVKENGERTAVVLRWEDFQALQAMLSSDPDLLPGLSRGALTVLSEGMLTLGGQERLAELLERNQQAELTDSELHELDALIEHVDQMNLLKARAMYTLQKLDEAVKLAA